MYNRYIPQNDGSYRKRTVASGEQSQPDPPRQPPPEKPEPQRLSPKPANPTGFLRNLLPREFDTGDLIIVLLLLLMAGDSEEERSNALLTLALYFFL